jgi:replicative DNA helicase
MAKKTPWKQQKEAYQESLHYLRGRQNGTITSLITPWSQVNNATTNGLEWHSMTVIGGRPGSGKTLAKDQLIKQAFKLNTTDNFRVLEFSLEMLGKNSAIRAYSSELGVTYKYLCSADGKLSNADLERCHEYAKKAVVYPIDIVEEAPTIEEFKDIITLYMEQHAQMKNGEKTYQNTVVTVDHSLLLKPIAKQNRNDMLYDLGETITSLKRKFPIIFIILSQLNRAIDHPERNEDGKYGNYVLESDIFGADALLQHADTVIGLNRPGKQKIRFYGPDRYIVPNDRLLVMHFLKCRNGENGLAFFHAAFERMTIDEAPVPAQQEMRTRGM